MSGHTWRELERADMDAAAAHRFDEERRAAMTELLPCPFCGGEAELHPTYDMDTNEVDGWFVWCNNKECECAPETREHFTEAEAIVAWNTRAERTCKPLGTIRYDYEGGYAGTEYETELSCGHKWRDEYGDYPDYCPNCGAKVVGR